MSARRTVPSSKRRVCLKAVDLAISRYPHFRQALSAIGTHSELGELSHNGFLRITAHKVWRQRPGIQASLLKDEIHVSESTCSTDRNRYVE